MDKYTLITGASSGIGRATSIQLSQHSPVILHGRNLSKLEEVKKQCSAAHRHIIWQYDLNDLQTLEASLEQLMRDNNLAIDQFVHSAGMVKMAPLKVSSADLLTSTFNVNVLSASMICKTLTRKNTNPTALTGVVFVSSNISNFGAKAMSAYGSSKGALDSLMRCLAVELAPTTRVNSVLPGAIRTAMTQTMLADTELSARMESMYPLGFSQANDISNAIQFLLSEQAGGITGQQLTVDRGRTINISG